MVYDEHHRTAQATPNLIRTEKTNSQHVTYILTHSHTHLPAPTVQIRQMRDFCFVHARTSQHPDGQQPRNHGCAEPRNDRGNNGCFEAGVNDGEHGGQHPILRERGRNQKERTLLE